ncbi:MAG: elongation factor 4 [Candidatus Marinimicrobia bacterium]|nr:elongation factor 4 [Candidatus Neomarinimicrobiota bacterium]
MNENNIRNFCIIAHIDHGKSTLADRFLEMTGTLSGKEMVNQVLDDMDIERERGITIKAHAITMKYKSPDGKEYTFNLIDTPGHVDFSYEVSRSLAACEGAILLVDASQGVEAQTVSNAYLAVEGGLKVIPVINKIDLGTKQIESAHTQLIELLGCKEEEIYYISAKTGEGVAEILEAVIERIPPPSADSSKPLRALIFDSTFDKYRGAIAYIRVFDGKITEGDAIKFFSSGKSLEASEIGILRMKRVRKKSLSAGEVGYLIAGAKDVKDIKVGDTVTGLENPANEPLPGYKESKPMVFSGIFPVDSEDFSRLRISLEKLQLNDASISFEPEASEALGFGFRCGYLGMLHMEIVQERLSREFEIDIIATVPNVRYRVELQNGQMIEVENPVKLPPSGEIKNIKEPYIRSAIITPSEYIGGIMKLAQEKRGIYKTTDYLDSNRAEIIYEFPLMEVLFDFYDRLKSVSRGYASLDYDHIDYREGKLTRLDILINGDRIDAFSIIVHVDKAYDWGRRVTEKLKSIIPRQMIPVALQAAVGGKIIARETVKAFRKNVTAKCYGGDITRKRKLLEKQKAGKKRMKQVGNVEVPQEAFIAVLQLDD